MGSLFNSPNIAAANFQANPKGIDLIRSRIVQNIGVYQVTAASAFQQGMMILTLICLGVYVTLHRLELIR